MEITVNGEKQTIENQVTVAQLLEGLDIDPETVVIERNLDILKLDDHSKTLLEEGDSIEIIRMVDGG
jgi:thiamine biosynthesis protein ThiS